MKEQNKKKMARSRTKELLMDVQQILNILGVYSKINKPKKSLKTFDS